MGINEDKRRQMEEMARKRRAERNQEQSQNSEQPSSALMQKIGMPNQESLLESGDFELGMDMKGEGRQTVVVSDQGYENMLKNNKAARYAHSFARGFGAKGLSWGAMEYALQNDSDPKEKIYQENKSEKAELVGEIIGGTVSAGGVTKAIAGKAAGKLAVKEGAGSVMRFAEGKLAKKATESSMKTLLKRGARLGTMHVMTGQLFRSDAKVVPNQEYITECQNLPFAARQQELLGLSTFIQGQMQNVQTMINERGYYTGTPVADASISK